MRVERIVLNDSCCRSLRWAHLCHIIAPYENLTLGRLCIRARHRQNGCLAAARRSKEDNELALGNLHIERVKHQQLPINYPKVLADNDQVTQFTELSERS